MRVSAAHVYVTRVIPTLRRVFQQIDRADGKGLALDDGVGATGHENRTRDKAQRMERTPRPERSRSRRRVVDKV